MNADQTLLAAAIAGRSSASANAVAANQWRKIRSVRKCMTDDQRSDEARETFAYFSNEYAQALQAFKTIEAQSSTLLLMGVGDDLRGFIEQFITMASGTKALAEERGESHFAEWFGELIRKAEALRSEIVPQ
jgi:hypothetical protein